MSSCDCSPRADAALQRRTLIIALTLNATMFVVELVAGVFGQSSGLIADSLDMLADASAYAVALLAIRRGERFKAGAARLSGILLLLLGLGVLADAARRGIEGSEPAGGLIIAVASPALVVNATVLHLLGRVRREGVHLMATWIFTRADVVANIGVIASGMLVALTGFRYVDLVAGAAIGTYVIKEASEILRRVRREAPSPRLDA